MEIKDFGRVGVLMGGPSSEREISFKSGHAVLGALLESGIEAIGINIVSESEEENVRLLKGYNLTGAFIALHGRFGEDGAIQEILEKINLPYTASGVSASRLAMDKISSLEVLKAGGLSVPRSWFIEKATYQRKKIFDNDLGLPLVVKPANHGSSIGLSLVEFKEELPAAIQMAFKFDERIIIEEYIYGRELTVGILGQEVLPVIEIIPKSKFFDFQAKYQSRLTQYIIPADLKEGTSKMVRQTALEAHRILGCSGCSRTDIMLSKDGLAYVLEVNTIPGMTSTSLLPKAANVVGINFNQLCIKLLELAYEKAKI
ncbi:MAG: D-alanine--D-alanine ligase [Candidatus Omnitrophica bacterium]|nr:D-alanine--D-alanine ligase [Candidatus Omnitrophota bacterium]